MIKEIFNKKNTDTETELGFGTKNKGPVRFLNKDGSVNIRRKIGGNHIGFDLYHWLISISWLQFISLVFASYIVVNTLFAVIYFSIGSDKFGGLDVYSQSEKFSQLFFFSAQTLTTVGYGHIYPNSVFTSSVSAVESMLGLMGFALVTGLLYGRFSKPRADMVYSDDAVVAPYEGITGFMFRVANRRHNELIEVECELVMSITNAETQKREFHRMELEVSRINFLPLTWTVVHPINDKSPMTGLTKQDLHQGNAEFIILIKAINDTYYQTVFSRMSYKAQEIQWDAKFTPMKQVQDDKGRISINLSEIHQTEKLTKSAHI